MFWNFFGPSLRWTPSIPPSAPLDKITELRAKVNADHTRVSSLFRRIDAAEVFQYDSQAYMSEAGEQMMRLQSIKLFEGDDRTCPLCSTDLSGTVPSVAEMNDSLRRLDSDLSVVESERPRLREYIDSLKDELANARQALVHR